MVPRWFFMVPGRFLWFFMVPGWFFIFHVENTLKLYSAPTIRSRPCRPLAGFGLVDQIIIDSPDNDHIIMTARMVKGLGDMYRLLIIVILA